MQIFEESLVSLDSTSASVLALESPGSSERNEEDEVKSFDLKLSNATEPATEKKRI